ncbi:hypothetical protein ACLZHR_09740 [Priestia aryabhattai]|uniref:hypothetical protein n=1 Tax=Priestia TaxID=2800373 RepID=UPI001C8D7DB1|nr:hypothetical protein [Priestia aryabhattai]MBY0074699.1 hypothetical protein [Priestia aryabhattai]
MGYRKKYLKGNPGPYRKKYLKGDPDPYLKKKWDHCDKDDDCKYEKKCEGCVCDQLRDTTLGRLITVRLFGVDTPLTLVFAGVCFDTCCVNFFDPIGGPSGSIMVLDCEKIQSISFPVV